MINSQLSKIWANHQLYNSSDPTGANSLGFIKKQSFPVSGCLTEDKLVIVDGPQEKGQ